jgi:hypothetical protein
VDQEGPFLPDAELRRSTPSAGLRVPLRGLRAAFGALLLVGTRPLARIAAGRSPDYRAIVFTRVLGMRHLGQAALLGGGGRAARLAGAAVDATHAATAMLLALSDPPRRRPLVVNALVASLFAVEGAAAARRCGR